MEVPGRLSDKEDSMSSHTARRIAAAVVLTTLLGISAAPAGAQPREARASGRAEASLLVRLWQWIEIFWSSSSTVERVHDNSTWTGTPDGMDSTSIRRGVTVDPNG
jgi:hypothetical protein